jgi:beta-lactamase regulating signal transducer with metallopeptidase domain
MTAFVPALLIKLSLILSLGLILSTMLRSIGPSFRHLVLYATLASCVALPFAMLMSPQWNVAVLPRESSGALQGTTNTTASNSVLTAKVIDAGTPQAPSIDAGAAQISAGAPQLSGGGPRGFPSLPLVPLVWLVGFLAVVAWLAVGRIGLRRIVRSAWPLNSADWKAILDEERAYAGVIREVLLSSSSAVSTPLTWRSSAPVILLPEDALDWPEAHRRIVLRHELAHVARGDSLTQLFAGFVCALYWFHPLVWMTERRLRAECERACDDNVVSLGTPAAEYAAHLLEVARSARAFGAPGFLSVAMARPTQLEGRLLAVLNESRRRVSLSRGARPAAALLAALVLLPLAAFRPVPKSDAPAKDGVVRAAPNAATEFIQARSTTPTVAQSGPPTTSTASAGTATRALATSTSNGFAISTSSGQTISTSNALGTFIATATATAPSAGPATTISGWSYQSGHAGSHSDAELLTSAKKADTTFDLSVPARDGGTLVLNIETGGDLVITGWDKPQVAVRALLGGRDWRSTRVQLEPTGSGARLETDFSGRSSNRSTSHTFQISLPRKYNVRIESSGGDVSITGVDGSFTGTTGGGEIEIQKAGGDVDIHTGGGDIHVADSHLNGNVGTGGGQVRIENVTGDLSGDSGGGSVIYNGKSGAAAISGDKGAYVGTKDRSITVHTGSGSGAGISTGSHSVSTTTTYSDDGGGLGKGFARSGIRMNSGGGDIYSPGAPDGGRFTTGGGAIRIGPSGGEVYASTGGGSIDIGPSTGSVEANTGAGDVRLELKGPGSHSVNIFSGKGEVTLVLPRDLNAVLELETAYTENLGHKTRIVSAIPLQTTETTNWDRREGTARRYVRARQTVGKGGGVIRVRTVNGDIEIKRAP